MQLNGTATVLIQFAILLVAALRRQPAAITKKECTWSATLKKFVALKWFTGGSNGSRLSKKTPTRDYTL